MAKGNSPPKPPKRPRVKRDLLQKIQNSTDSPVKTRKTIHATKKTKETVAGRTSYIPRVIMYEGQPREYETIDPKYDEFMKQQKELLSSVFFDSGLFSDMDDVLKSASSDVGWVNKEFDGYVRLIRMSTNTIKKLRKELDATSQKDMANLKEAMQFVITGYDHLLSMEAYKKTAYQQEALSRVSNKMKRAEELIFQTGRHASKDLKIGADFAFYDDYVKLSQSLQKAYNAYKITGEYYDPVDDATTVAMVIGTHEFMKMLRNVETASDVEYKAEIARRAREEKERIAREKAKAKAEKEARKKRLKEEAQAERERKKRWAEEAKRKKEAEREAKKKAIEERKRLIEEAKKKKDAEYQEFVNSIILSGEDFEVLGPMTSEELLEKGGFEKRTFVDKLMRVLREDALYREISNLVSGVVGSIMGGAKQAVNVTHNLYSSLSTVLDFSDLFSFPIQAVMATLLTGVNALTVTLSATDSAIGGVLGAFKFIAGLDENDMEETFDERNPGRSTAVEHGDESPHKSIFRLTLNSIRFIFMAFSIGFSALASVMKFGMSMFTDILTIIIKFMKEIVKTSELMGQIQNIFNLALIMFFMPFFNVFGDVLLESIYKIVMWSRDFYKDFDPITMGLEDTAKKIGAVFEEIKASTSGINEEFTEVVKDAVKELVPPMLDVINYFINTFINNKETLVSMLKTGIEVAQELLKNGIFKVMLNYGIKAMEFLSANANFIVSTIKTAGEIVDMVLGMFTFVMNHFWLFCVAMGSALVSLLMMAGFVAGNAGALLNIASKVSAPLARRLLAQGITKYGLMGGGLGAILGGVFYAYFFAFAEGGYIPATPGGLLSIVAEKETEYIIPESKVEMIRGHNNVVITFNDDVYLFDNPKSELKDAINDVNFASNYR